MAFSLKCILCPKRSMKAASYVICLNVPYWMRYQHATSPKILSGTLHLIRDEIPVSTHSLGKLPEHKHAFSETENYIGNTEPSSKSVVNFSPELLALIFSWTFKTLNSHLLVLTLLTFLFIEVFRFLYFSLTAFYTVFKIVDYPRLL